MWVLFIAPRCLNKSVYHEVCWYLSGGCQEDLVLGSVEEKHQQLSASVWDKLYVFTVIDHIYIHVTDCELKGLSNTHFLPRSYRGWCLMLLWVWIHWELSRYTSIVWVSYRGRLQKSLFLLTNQLKTDSKYLIQNLLPKDLTPFLLLKIKTVTEN